MPSDDRVSQVVQHFEESILTGRLKPGDLLPPERDLSAELKVSRSVVREALGQLASMGLVRRQQGSGTRVCRPTSAPTTTGFWKLLQAQGLKESDLLAVRVLLEPAIARRALQFRIRSSQQGIALSGARPDRSSFRIHHRCQAFLPCIPRRLPQGISQANGLLLVRS